MKHTCTALTKMNREEKETRPSTYYKTKDGTLIARCKICDNPMILKEAELQKF